MKKTAMIILILFCQNVIAQRDVQKLFMDQDSTEHIPDWFSEYRNANYVKSYETLSNQKIIPIKTQFLRNSLLYGNQKDGQYLDTVNWGMSFYNQFDDAMSKFNQSKTVKLKLERNVFGAKIGNDSIKVLLDTGGDGVSISKRLVEKYGLPTDTTITISSFVPAFKRTSKESPTIIDKISFGSIDIRNLPAKFETDVINGGQYTSNQEYDIIMGVDALIGLVDHIKFDWTTNEITFSESAFDMKNPIEFMVFDAKPITVLKLKDQSLTTLIDTGAPTDILNYESYKDTFTEKVTKKYGDYSYNLYTVPIQIGNSIFNLGIGDYLENFNLELDGEKIDLIIGTAHKRLTLNLDKNILEIN